MNADIVRSKAPSGRVFAVLKDSIIYGIFIGISKMPMILLLPILTYFLTKEDYGILDAFINFATVAISLAFFGQDAAIGRVYYDENSSDARRRLITTALLIVGLSSLVSSVAAFVFADEIAYKIIGSENYATELRMVACYVPFMALIHIFRFVTRWTFNKKAFLLLNAAPAISLVIFTFIFVAVLNLGIQGALIAQIATGVIFLCIGIYICRSFLTLQINKVAFLPLLKYGLPVMAAYVLIGNISVIDKAMYSDIFGTGTLGTYAFGARYGFFAFFVTAAFASGWGPIVLSTYKLKDGFATIQKTLNMVSGAFALILFLQMALAEIAVRILAPSGGYDESLKYALPIAMAAYLNGIAAITGIGIELSKKTHMYFISLAAGYILLFTLPKLLIPFMGSVGIAYVVLAAYSIMFVAVTAIGCKLYPFHFKIIKVLLALVFSFGACLLFQSLDIDLVGQIILRACLFAGLGLFVWLNLIHTDDRKKILDKLLSVKARLR